MTDPREIDLDYDRHGGFPRFDVRDAPEAFGRFVAAMRRAEELAITAAADEAGWAEAERRVNDLIALLEPFESAEGVGPAGRVPNLPGAGSLLMPPWEIQRFDPDGVEVGVQFSRFHVGGNNAVHGGVIPMMFDTVFGIILHATNQPTSRTAFLHVDYRNVTPINVPLVAHGRLTKVEGRKAFVESELLGPDGTLCAQAHGLMVSLLPGQP